ncbi:hypothetical protein GIB67_031587 [Kingdonia uniflora]|uniref:Protein kinase domain-containing protein n=1 Tax=Kingdonia uniflora TaxID=39325 RepID=A0A7J7LY74_9MAGN|nr:hypothetical protein GIB67_031587 [Kingdonia uniflora]
MMLKTLFLSLFFAMLFRATATDPISETLFGLKSEITDTTNSLYDWSNETPFCSWSGITCTQNSTEIISLDLSDMSLAGKLSGKHLGNFSNLINLNLSYNSFSGQLPVEIFGLGNLRLLDISRNNFSGGFPSGISGIPELVVLDAMSNSFSGGLPSEVAQLDYLKVLNFAGSYFEGPIPSAYGSFKSLEFLHLAGNLLNGEIPVELGKLKTLGHMEIGYNSYHGGIPWQLGNMSELQYLDIAGANISALIPNYVCNLAKLQSLFLFRNKLSGFIPGCFGNLTKLEVRLLSLMYNKMSGTVPEGIASLPLLDTLLIWNNFFSGPLPRSLGNNSQLKWVDVSTNSFNGTVPPDICARGVLAKLILFSNNFTGAISKALANCSSLVRVRIEDNSFCGEIPLSFGLLPDITYVDISRNRFIGGIPREITQASKLEYFNVSQNLELRGTIPPKLWSMPLLRNFSASSCDISGDLPQFESCSSVSVIELNMNNVSGKIPDSVANCKVLESMSLANNNLTGEIPEEFGHISSLVLLNLSFNDFFGLVPSVKSFRLMGASSFMGNQNLCGAPLQPCEKSNVGRKSSGKLIWVLLLCFGVAFLSVMGIFYLRRERKDRWKVVPFIGLPRFTEVDILKSFNYTDSVETAVLPTGIKVSVKKIKWDAKKKGMMSEFISLLGNARHKNLIRLLGFCCNNQVVFLLYDYLPNGTLTEKIRTKRESGFSTWEAKHNTVIGIASGLYHLHHECYPAIPHGDFKGSNIVFDENMEPRLIEFGLKALLEMKGDSLPGRIFRTSSVSQIGEPNATIEECRKDVYNFGEILLEILTNGRLTNAGGTVQSKPRETLLRDIYDENKVGANDACREEIKMVYEVAMLCTKSRPSDRPSMDHAMKLLSGSK